MPRIPNTGRLVTSAIQLGMAIAASAAAAPLTYKADVASASASGTSRKLFQAAAQHPNATVIRIDQTAWVTASQLSDPFVIERFPLSVDLSVDLRVQRFRVAGPHTSFVIGRSDGPDTALDFDPESVVLLRGSVIGRPGSHVFLSISEFSSTGRIELGPGAATYRVSSNGGSRLQLDAGQLAVFEGRNGGSMPAAPLCATDDGWTDASPHQSGGGTDGPDPIRGLRQSELAVDADYEFFRLFDDEVQAAAYLVQVYGIVSDIYMRDMRARLDMVFLRVWTDPDDPYGEDVGMPVIPDGVQFDMAQLMSGRKDARAGGAAFMCGRRSWVAYALGFFVTPDTPHVYNQDFRIAAHEMGHNFGGPHTHSIGIDECDDPGTAPRRGSLLSYCSQTFSGGSALTDLRIHTAVQQRMFDCLAGRPDIVFDCNQNSVDDTLDIQSGFSPDKNANGIPDECEDCNDNGVLDDEDISSGRSQDLNGNGMPDECEPDCNGNDVPDDLDISTGASQDLYGNGIPDECETDCNDNGQSDYNEILADMSLDIDRNAVLDACQDCDGDGTPDLVALDGANDMWAASLADNAIRQYHAQTGVLRATSSDGGLDQPQDVIITPDARVLVSSAGNDLVAEFDRAGAFVGNLVTPGSGGLDHPTGMTLAPDGSLLVASRNTNSVLRYDTQSGAFLGEFVAPGAGGLLQPFGVAFGPSGSLFVTSSDNQVLEYDGASGAFLSVFVSNGNNGGLSAPRSILFTRDRQRFLIASLGTDAVLEYDPQTGDFRGQFNNGDYRGRLVQPWGLRTGPSGHIYVSSSGTQESDGGGSPLHLTVPFIFEYDSRNGNLLRAYVQGLDAQLLGPSGFDFIPGDDADCNWNQIPDSCDIADGVSRDVNGNGVPDECEQLGDLNCDGAVNSFDIDPFLLALFEPDQYESEYPDCDINNGDINGDGAVDAFDIEPFIDLLFGP